MRNNSKKILIISVLALAMMGCEALGFNEYSKRNAESADVLAKMEQARGDFNDVSKVVRIEQPPVSLTPLDEVIDTSYLMQRVSVSQSRVPLSLMMDDLLSQVGVTAWYGDGVAMDAPVSLNFEGPLSGALNAIERQLNIGFAAEEDRVKVERFVSKTFELELPPGMINDQIGASESSGGGDEEGGETKIEGQYVTLSNSDVDTFTEVAEGIKALLAQDPDLSNGEAGKPGSDNDSLVGSVRAIPALSRIVVRTTPSRMEEVIAFVNDNKSSLTRQVAVEVQILEFRSNLGHNRGVDWNLIRDIGGGNSLSFFIPGTDLLSNSANPSFAFTGGGKWDGTTALINALNKQGQVSTETPITILVQNHQTNHVTQENIIEFVENTKSNSSEGVVTTETERGKRREGVDFIVVPNIQRDHVYLRASGMLTKIEALVREEVAGEIQTFPRMRESKINFANKLKYGQTMVIASVSQTDTGTEENTFLGIPFLGGTSAKTQRVDTLVLLTPRRAD
ncbi:hypothetical protein RJD38_21690 (plasmid) [Vibrio scophthalmi]|uniref:type II secretion system protein GspD n=1 Tax=Vibrio scophthalmi TaxID=45658 RepID=UPI00080998BC|nr:hypothetical protein [Vibrio scophthalmi]ANS88111.1 hypothetical protein VSVS12_04412 [Vibrio scophthalmi]